MGTKIKPAVLRRYNNPLKGGKGSQSVFRYLAPAKQVNQFKRFNFTSRECLIYK
jgi:hypothetical protein